MSYLNYNIDKTFSLLLQQLKLSSFISIILSCIFLGVILYVNKDNKIINYIFIVINIILISLIVCLYMKSILKFNFSHSLKNIYFYFLNSIIYLTLVSIINKKIFQCKINIIIYVLNLIGIIYSLIMTIYLKNIIIVIGNVFPQIFFGNILILISYITLVLDIILTKKN